MRSCISRRFLYPLIFGCVGFAYMAFPGAAVPQDAPETEIPKTEKQAVPFPAVIDPPPATANTTEIERLPDSTATGAEPVSVSFKALLTENSGPIDEGLIWRIYREKGASEEKSKLLSTFRDAAPVLSLSPGAYWIVVSLGRARQTRRIDVKPGVPLTENFILNAGALRLTAQIDGVPAASDVVTFTVYSDIRDRSDERIAVIKNAPHGKVIPLNAGIYQVVSQWGNANATKTADVTVETGKRTEVDMDHTGAAMTFKLARRAGGDAIPDTEWTIETRNGKIVVRSEVGAFSKHILEPGVYTVKARSGGGDYKREFTVENAAPAEVELIIP